MKKIIITALIIVFSNKLNASSIKSDENVTLYPTYAFIKNGQSIAQIHAHIYEPEKDSPVRNLLVSGLSSFFDINENRAIFNKRTAPFLVDNERNKKIKISLKRDTFELKRSKSNGHSVNRLQLSSKVYNSYFKNNKTINYSVVLDKTDKRAFKGELHFISKEGLSVISDIDDTIKISNVLNKKKLIKKTFLSKFEAVPGMSNIYNQLKESGASFHYVSGSPWQLYPAISEFITTDKFPHGSMHLKYFRLKDKSSLQFIVADQLDYKLKVIKSIISDFPKRKFILIGDSGEKDPEIYAKIAEFYPKQIKTICIRNLSNSHPKRFKKLYENLTNTEIIIFKNSNELYKLLNLSKK